MVILYSYVSLPEGNPWKNLRFSPSSRIQPKLVWLEPLVKGYVATSSITRDMQTLVSYWLFRTSPKREPRSTKHLTFGSLFKSIRHGWLESSHFPYDNLWDSLAMFDTHGGCLKIMWIFLIGVPWLVKNYDQHLLSPEPLILTHRPIGPNRMFS